MGLLELSRGRRHTSVPGDCCCADHTVEPDTPGHNRGSRRALRSAGHRHRRTAHDCALTAASFSVVRYTDGTFPGHDLNGLVSPVLFDLRNSDHQTERIATC